MKEKGQDKQTKMDQEKFKSENILKQNKKQNPLFSIFREILEHIASIKPEQHTTKKEKEKRTLDT